MASSSLSSAPPMDCKGQQLEIFERAKKHAAKCPDHVAIISRSSHWKYSELLDKSQALSETILSMLGNYDGKNLANVGSLQPDDSALSGNKNIAQVFDSSIKPAEVLLENPRIAFCLPANVSYTITQWATWMSQGIAVPLYTGHPVKELEYIIEDSGANIVVFSPETKDIIHPICVQKGIPWIQLCSDKASVLSQEPTGFKTKNPVSSKVLSQRYDPRSAMLIYTSGTTGRPKGVVWTHDMLEFWANNMNQVWGWTNKDRITNWLPLHHVHGILNIVFTSLWSGAQLSMEEKFSVSKAWHEFQNPSHHPTVFMGVPTMYSYLISAYDDADESTQAAMRRGAQRLRLFVSGSAALQATYFQAWRRISGQDILERYGMTEVGMPLTNPLNNTRREGFVGMTMPGITATILAENDEPIPETQFPVVGQLALAGQGVFKRYWRRKEATMSSFDKQGFFKTGDVVEKSEDGWFRILGRSSVDIIKCSGYKISALEIERELLEHPNIAQVAVVGLPDDRTGEKIACMVVPKNPEEKLDANALRIWAKDRLASYKIPTVVRVGEIPRNAMGKIEKKKVALLFLDG